MTRQRAKELLPIIQAYAEGRQVQTLIGNSWDDISNPDFYAYTKYRIKPEPREWYEIIYKTNKVRVSDQPAFISRDEALQKLVSSSMSDGLEVIKVCEAIE